MFNQLYHFTILSYLKEWNLTEKQGFFYYFNFFILIKVNIK